MDYSLVRPLLRLSSISVTPAIVAAIRQATGRDLNRVPVRPQDICLD